MISFGATPRERSTLTLNVMTTWPGPGNMASQWWSALYSSSLVFHIPCCLGSFIVRKVKWQTVKPSQNSVFLVYIFKSI